MNPTPGRASTGFKHWRMEFALDDLRLYARCPLEWFWEKRAGIPRPQTITALAPEALRSALLLYYAGHADTLGKATGLVWRDWCEGWGELTIAADLSRYARGRAEILSRIVRPDGGHYTAPQMTTSYRDQMFNAGLTRLGHQLDDFARSHGLLPPDEKDYPGSVLGDVYADCLVAAERVSRNQEAPLPGRELVLDWQVPYQVDLGNGMRLTGVADLATRALPEAGEKAVVLEVHDYHAQPGIKASWASRDIRVIAAALAQPTDNAQDNAGQPITWEQVDRVIYRYWPSGLAYTFRDANTGHLLAVVAATVRGMSNHVVIPRALTGYDNCRSCAYRRHCWDEDNWETLHLIDAGTLGRAEQLRGVVRQALEAIRGDGQAARHAVRAVKAIYEALRIMPFDRMGNEATLIEVEHQLGIIADER